MSQFAGTISDRGTHRKGHELWAIALLLGLTVAGVSPSRLAAAQGSGQQGVGQISDAEKALRQRTTEFYSLVRTAQTARAEEYVMKAGRERFRTEPSGPFLEVKIISVELDPNGKDANEVIEMTVLNSMVGGLVPFQRKLHWQIEDGEWRLQMPDPGIVGNDSLMGIGKGLEEPAKPEELKFKGHGYEMGVIKPGEHKEIRFPFTNTSDHTVKITQIATGCDCMKTNTQKMEYKPGESGEVVFDFDSTGYEFGYAQTVVVRTDPGNIASYLHVQGNVVSQAIVDSQNKHSQPTPQPTPPSNQQPAAPLNHQ